MSACRCTTPPFHYTDFESEFIGIDETNGRFGEVSVETCKTCGSKWLRYFVEYEAVTQSGRWYRGLIEDKDAINMKPKSAAKYLERLDWYFYGGSHFATTGARGFDPQTL